ncbi:hypothetical protein [Bacillus sp. HSf4]|uniref:hypothetical protein n=1 Tax=Bacillus sp. HSf4 TaxID=3035514 RepID=UPI0024091FF3|nr:hypothetical protein [Bacillus sp. HSf4]WFA07026.1 hypothetical protein P3X63_09745 [Bacillus sp. HSf4]
MRHIFKKMFSLNDIQFFWVLIASSILFAFSFYFDRIHSHDPFWIVICYYISFAIAVVWGAVNYISHIRMNAMYNKQNDIRAYVNQLAMNEEEKLELQTYLEDYVEDLISQGKTKDEAAAEAINQFKVKEFLSLSKSTSFFNLHAHHYLFGWSLILMTALFLLWLFGIWLGVFPLMFLVIEATLFAYGFGFFGMFFVYKLVDAAIYKKFKELLS